MAGDRGGYIAGLRALADLLEQHDELPLPYDGAGTVPEPRALAAAVRVAGA